MGRTALSRFVFTLVGFTAVYAVAIVFFYYDWLFHLPFVVDPLLYGVCLNGSLCGGAVIVVLLMKKGVRSSSGHATDTVFGRRTKVLTLLGIVFYLSAFVQLVLSVTLSEATLVYSCGVCAGCAAGMLIPLWFEQTRHLVKNGTAYTFGFMSIISVVVVFGVNLLPLFGVIAVCVALLVVSIISLWVVKKRYNAPFEDDHEGAGEGARDQKKPDDPHKAQGAQASSQVSSSTKPWASLLAPAIYVFLLSVMYGMLDTVAMASESIPASSSGSSSLVGGIAADIIFLLYVRYDGKRYSALLNGSLAVIATGLLFLPFLPDAYNVALVVLTHMAWEISLLVLFTLVVDVYRPKAFLLTMAAAVVFALPRPGVIVGSVFASVIAVNAQYTFAQITIIAFALLYLVFMGVVLLRTREKRAADKAIRKRDELIERYSRARDELYDLACEEIAAEFRLTERETELLKLLAQGRDAAYIEKALFLSRNTVKSYTRSIYAKIGVHSKQDLIDYVKTSLSLE